MLAQLYPAACMTLLLLKVLTEDVTLNLTLARACHWHTMIGPRALLPLAGGLVLATAVFEGAV